MESFSKVDIFDTKGIEYLFVIGYLVVLIIFWNVVNRPEKIIERINKIKSLTIGALRIPQGLLFSRLHTWTHLEASGEAKVGIDDFIHHIAGDYQLNILRKPGDIIQKGDLITQIAHDGKHLDLFSPISGTVTVANSTLVEYPEILHDYPCEKTWVYKIKPMKWKEETQSYLMAEDATRWFNSEIERLKDFLAGGMSNFPAEPSMTMLQDGGEIRVNVLSELPEVVWADFQKEFLSTVT